MDVSPWRHRRQNKGHNATVGYASIRRHCLCFNCSSMHNYWSFYVAQDRPPVSHEQFSFLENIFNKTKLEEKTWAKLVNLNTLHWYCDGPKPTKVALRYEAQVRARKSITFSFLLCLFNLQRSSSIFCRNGCC